MVETKKKKKTKRTIKNKRKTPKTEKGEHLAAAPREPAHLSAACVRATAATIHSLHIWWCNSIPAHSPPEPSIAADADAADAADAAFSIKFDRCWPRTLILFCLGQMTSYRLCFFIFNRFRFDDFSSFPSNSIDVDQELWFFFFFWSNNVTPNLPGCNLFDFNE